jgi:phosphoribosyl-ATP pyrophosphohydrolase/phosphoribosyl-AMP cyclohydrolase
MKIDFSKGAGLIPAIVQDNATHKVLMLGYMNEDALNKTMETRRVTFFSRSKQRLWTKGETSGNFLELIDIVEDCDGDALLVRANPVGPVCHTGQDTCFAEVNATNALFLHHLQQVISQRRETGGAGSYTRQLFDRGINKIAQKVGEEAVELVIEAKDQNADLFRNEAADLLYHLLVLLEAKDIRLEEVIDVLRERHQ